MGQALIHGMLKVGFMHPSSLVVWDSDRGKLKKVSRVFKVRVGCSNPEAARAGIIILAVKPQQMEEVLEEIKGSLAHRPLVISIAAGVSTRWIEKRLGKGIPVVRVMPNTPALVGVGMSAVAGGTAAGQGALRTAERILGCVGRVVRVPERMINAVTAVSGSGPAYFFYLMEKMIETGRALGLPRAVAQELVLQTAAGAALLAASSGEDPRALRARVTSKGGTTEAAFKVFERGQLGAVLERGIRSAAARAKEMGG